MERLEPIFVNGLDYLRAITDLHLRETPVIVWDGFEYERGKGWDCEEAAALEFVSL